MDLQEFDSLRAPPSRNWPKFWEERRNRYFLRLGWCCRSPHLTSGHAVTQAGTAKAVWREQWERNHTEQSIFSDIVMWLRWGGVAEGREGSCFQHQWHLKDTPQRFPENSYEPARPHWVRGQGWVTSCLSVTAGHFFFFSLFGCEWEWKSRSGCYCSNIIAN